MPDKTIKNVYLNNYSELRNRLRAHLGSYHQADDILHDTWIQLQQAKPVTVTRPLAYLFRMAKNISISEFRRQAIFDVDTEALLHFTDDALGPEEHSFVADEIKQLNRALDNLPSRRREILVAHRLYGVSKQELAERFGVSTRTIEKELKSALEFAVSSKATT